VTFKRLSLPLLLSLLLSAGLVSLSHAGWWQQEADLAKAIDQTAQGNYDAAVALLERLKQGTPSEAVYYYLGNAHWQHKSWEKARAVFEEGIAAFPLSGRLHNAAALAYEQQFDLAKAVQYYRKALALDPTIAYTGGGRYDPEFRAIYIPIVHDHRGANSCSGRLYVDEQKLHFVVYIVASGWGIGNDDSFETTLSNIELVEVDRKKGQLANDYSLITLLTNLSGPRRRIASGEESRVDLKFVFKQPVKGYRGNEWTKSEIKFFFIEPEVGDRYLKFLEAREVKVVQRKA
jgi:tetratricopeptide (TPR) repeat protein